MLFKEIHLQGIKSGKISLAFRKWQKASAKAGSLLHTSIGLVEIIKIVTVDENDITDEDALSAGFTNKDQLLKSFVHNNTGTILRYTLHIIPGSPYRTKGANGTDGTAV